MTATIASPEAVIQHRNLMQVHELARMHRVMWTLLAILGLNLIDLTFTYTCSVQRGFVELNPLAARLSPMGLVAFKLSMMAIGSAMLMRLRFHPLAEMGCWALLGIYSVIVSVWVYSFRILMF